MRLVPAAQLHVQREKAQGIRPTAKDQTKPHGREANVSTAIAPRVQ